MTNRSSFVRKWDPADEPILDYVTLNILDFLWVGFFVFEQTNIIYHSKLQFLSLCHPTEEIQLEQVYIVFHES